MIICQLNNFVVKQEVLFWLTWRRYSSYQAIFFSAKMLRKRKFYHLAKRSIKIFSHCCIWYSIIECLIFVIQEKKVTTPVKMKNYTKESKYCIRRKRRMLTPFKSILNPFSFWWRWTKLVFCSPCKTNTGRL